MSDERDVMDEKRRLEEQPESTEPSPDAPPTDEERAAREADEEYTTETPQDRSRPAVQLDPETDEERELYYVVEDDEELNRLTADDNAEVVLNRMSDHTEDQEILDDFAERQVMPTGEQGLTRRLREHHSESPDAGDVDAAWDEAEDAGDEMPSTEPMPDQDRVDEIGEALGVTYEDDEPLDFAGKVWNRDEERWELNPASAEQYSEEDEAAQERAAEEGVEQEVVEEDTIVNEEEDRLDPNL